MSKHSHHSKLSKGLMWVFMTIANDFFDLNSEFLVFICLVWLRFAVINLANLRVQIFAILIKYWIVHWSLLDQLYISKASLKYYYCIKFMEELFLNHLVMFSILMPLVVRLVSLFLLLAKILSVIDLLAFQRIFVWNSYMIIGILFLF